jgi:TonB family protein
MGHADMSTFKALKESNPLFTSAVKSALPNAKFAPATVGGRKVKQLVQMPFQFSLSKTTGTAGAPVRPQPSPAQSGVNTLATVVTTAVGERKAGQPVLSASTQNVNSGTQFRARPRPGNAAPRYPDALRSAGMEGEVVLQFVVNADGLADMETLKVLKSTDPQFVDAVKVALPQMRFYPAEVNGRAVRQLTQMPFQFTLSKP